ncbi:phage tail protein [Virgibacillus salexigens]|uniref:phage tail protein n=1 Tax=Virgibacillus salexigens TaxID=61016 RepID=UPI0030815325
MAKRIKGITIELDGETKGLDKALKDVNKRSIELSDELREVEKALKFNPGNTELLAQKQKLLADQVENSSKKLDQLRKAQSQVEKQFKSGDIGEEQYRAFQREVIKAESQLDGFKKKLASVDDGKELDNLQKDMKGVKDSTDKAESSVSELGSALGGLAAGVGSAGAIEQALDFSTLDTQIDISFNVPEESKQSVKQAVKDVSAYGVDAEEALEGVRRQWALNADASDETNAKVVKGASAVASAYAGIDFTELIQETNEIAAALGISNEEALGLTDSLLKAGFPPEQVDIIAEYGTQLSMAGFEAEEIQAIFASGVDTKTWNIDNLIDGLKEGNVKIKEFGEEVPEAVDELLKGTDISAEQLQQWGKDVAKGGETGKKAMSDVAAALAGVDDETKKSQLGVQIFGTMYEDQGQAITDVLINAQDATYDLKEGTDGVADSVSKMDADPAVQMKQAFTDIKTALGPLLEQIANFVSKVAEWVKKNPELTATIIAIVSAIGILVGIFMVLSPIITSLVALAGALGVSIGAIAAPVLIIIGVITALITVFVLLWQNWDSVSQFLVNSWNWIKEMSVTIFTGIGEFLKILWNGIWEFIKFVAQGIWGTIQAVWTMIKTITVSTWNAIWATIKTLAQGIWGTVQAVWNMIKVTTQTIWNGIKSVISTVWNLIKSIVQGAINVVKNVITTVWNTIKAVTSTVWNTIKSVISTVWNTIKSIVTKAINGVKSTVSSVWNVIKSITSSVWNGITSTVTGIWNGLKRTVSSVFNGIKDTISGAWDGVKSATDNIWDGITGTVKGAINGVISAINGMINALNGLDISLPKIPDWVPGLGGKGGGSIGFPTIPNVPYLKRGTNYVESEGLAYLHEGEAVVPKKYNPSAGGKGDGNTYNITIVSPDPTSPSENARKIKQVQRQLAMEAGW